MTNKNKEEEKCVIPVNQWKTKEKGFDLQ